MYNSYKFTSLRTLREALRAFKDLEASLSENSGISATIYLDLKHALGDDPTRPVNVLTKHQRKLVQQYLIDSLPLDEVAKKNDISPRVVLYGIRKALQSLMTFLENQTEQETNVWKPWMIDLMRDPYLTLDEIALRVGKSKHAVDCAMTRYRKSESLPFRSVRKRITRGESE